MERRHRTVLVFVLLSFATALAVATIWFAYSKYSEQARANLKPEHATGTATRPR